MKTLVFTVFLLFAFPFSGIVDNPKPPPEKNTSIEKIDGQKTKAVKCGDCEKNFVYPECGNCMDYADSFINDSTDPEMRAQIWNFMYTYCLEFMENPTPPGSGPSDPPPPPPLDPIPAG